MRIERAIKTADRKAVGRSYVDRSPALEEVICNFTSPKALSLRRQPGTYSCHNGRDEAHHVLRAPSALQFGSPARIYLFSGAHAPPATFVHVGAATRFLTRVALLL